MLSNLSRPALLCALLVAPLAAQTAQEFHIPDNDPTMGTCNTIPFGWGSPISYQTIVPAADLEAGYITSLAFAPCTTGVATYVNLQIRFGHAASPTLGTSFAGNFLAGPGDNVLVLSRASVDWNLTADTWSPIALDEHFNYNGVDDLIVQITCDAHIGGGACHRYNTGQRLIDTTSSSAGTGTLDTAPAKMRIGMGEYAYSDSTDPTTGTCNVFPFGQAQMRYQQIIPASDLPNHAGIIRDIAFSPCATGTTTYSQLDITIANSAVTSFNTANTFASNIAGGATVCLSGSHTYNYTSGEWSNVGLTSGFFWDGVSDVIIDITAFGGTQAFHRDATRWRCWNTNAAATNPSGAAATALKIRLTVECAPATRAISAFSDGCGPNPSGPLGIGTDVSLPGNGLPVLGGTHYLLMRFGPSAGLGAFVLGFNNGAPYPQPIPGAPGCFQRIDNIGVLITFFQPTGFSDPVPFTLTNDPSFCGLPYFVQGAAFWPGANPLGVITSNVLTMRIGN